MVLREYSFHRDFFWKQTLVLEPLSLTHFSVLTTILLILHFLSICYFLTLQSKGEASLNPLMISLTSLSTLFQSRVTRVHCQKRINGMSQKLSSCIYLYLFESCLNCSGHLFLAVSSNSFLFTPGVSQYVIAILFCWWTGYFIYFIWLC